MKVSGNPRFKEFAAQLRKAGGLAKPWLGVAYRSVAPLHTDPSKLMSGEGSYQNGGRWNAPGSQRAVYASETAAAALSEAQAHFRYYGFAVPAAASRPTVPVEFKLARVLDLTDPSIQQALGLDLAEMLAEDWRKVQDGGNECLTQALGRAVAAAGYEGMIVPSVAAAGTTNIVFFPANQAAASIARPRMA